MIGGVILITTRNNIKTLLKITDTTYDTMIDLLLPIIQSDILEFLRNKFLTEIEIDRSTISFSGNTITDTSGKLLDDGFVAGNIVVQNSKMNNGFYTVTSVTSTTLAVAEDLVTESADNVIQINQVVFPKGLELICANMIGFAMNNKHGVKSETFSRYSVSYPGDTQSIINGYPDSITRPLIKWRKPYSDTRFYYDREVSLYD